MKQKIQRSASALVLATASLMSVDAAAGLSNEQLLDVLLQNGAINHAQYKKLSKLAKEDSQVAKKAIENEVRVSLKGGHLKIKSTDGDFSMGIGGRMMVDTGWFSGNSNNIAGSNYQNGSELHRFRIHMKGKVFHDFKYQFAYDFGGKGTIKDAWIAYTGLEKMFDLPVPMIITVGNDKEPLGLEYINSSKYLTFMERGLTQSLVPERAIGISLKSHGELGEEGVWTFWGGWYGNDVNKDNRNIGKGGDKALGSQAFAGRITLAPIVTKTEVLHFGASVEQRYYSASNNNLKFKARPEQHRASNFTGQPAFTHVDNTTKFGLEASGVYGPFALQGEYMRAHVVNANPGGQNANFDAWYGFASWFVTGESRRYKKHEGAFTRVKPARPLGKGGWGALEMAYRYSYLDLSANGAADFPNPTNAVQGGIRHNSTIGLNWYPNSTVKFMANYVWSHGTAKPTVVGTNYNAFQLRAQIDF